jgi:tetratricopeptide (TPR) repeat protein
MAVLRMWSQIYPNDVGAFEQLATLSIVRQDLPGAVAAYEQILAIDPSRVQYLDDLADLHTQLGDLDAAEACLKRYVDAFPTRADGYEDLSDFYSRVGRLDEAREALARAQLLEPENRGLALSLVDLDLKVGEYAKSEQALADLLAGARTPRDRLRVHARLLRLAALRGRSGEVVDQADALGADLLEIQNPLQANISISLLLPAVSLAGRPQAALARLAEVRSAIPAPYDALAGVGEAWVHADLGQVTEARAVLAKAVTVVETYRFETFRASIALVEGMIEEADGDLAAAVVHYREAAGAAMQVEPVYRVRLGRALRLAGDLDEARAVLDEAVKVEPSHPEYRLELAHLAYARGDLARAQAHLQVALAAWDGADPEYRPAQEARELEARIVTP